MSQKLGLPPKDFCDRAVAYLKGLFDDTPDNPGNGPVVELSFDDSMAFSPLCEGLGVAYLVDAGDHFHYVQYRDLRAAGISIDEMHETAVRNLAAICRERLEIRKHSNIYAFLMGGNFESSCMLVDDLFDRLLGAHIKNGYVAAVPARDLFAVCSRDSASGIRELRELVDRAWPTCDHLVSKRLYVREDSKWRPMLREDLAGVFPRGERGPGGVNPQS